MDTATDDYAFLISHFLRLVDIRADRHQVARIASKTLAQHFAVEFVSRSRILLEPSEVALQVRVSVGVAMRQEQSIVVVVKGCCKSQCEVMEGALSLEAVCVVANVLATADPAFVIALGINFRV